MNNRTDTANAGQHHTTTWYVRDASGNLMATYQQVGDGEIRLLELPIYGSSRLGVVNVDKTLSELMTGNITTHQTGQKQYELSNHLGNVLTTISDQKKPVTDMNGNLLSYQPEILFTSDYYPFGMQMQGRKYTGEDYRYSFQGQEQDNETGWINYKYRMHDPRIGRFFAVDPLAKKFPHISTYAFSENVVINSVELEGLERDLSIIKYNSDTKEYATLFFMNFSEGQRAFGDGTLIVEDKGDFYNVNFVSYNLPGEGPDNFEYIMSKETWIDLKDNKGLPPRNKFESSVKIQPGLKAEASIFGHGIGYNLSADCSFLNSEYTSKGTYKEAIKEEINFNAGITSPFGKIGIKATVPTTGPITYEGSGEFAKQKINAKGNIVDENNKFNLTKPSYSVERTIFSFGQSVAGIGGEIKWTQNPKQDDIDNFNRMVLQRLVPTEIKNDQFKFSIDYLNFIQSVGPVKK